MDDKEVFLIHVYAGKNNSGPVFEEVPARKIENDTYELLSTPGLALNLARGDIVEWHDRQPMPAKVLKRGGNFCIQIYADAIDDEILKSLEKTVQEDLQGSLDGVFGGNLSLAVPASNGVDRVNNFFDQFTKKTGIQWYYGNIYKNFENPDDETLLDWWMH
jgi:hypothetical protein